MQTRTFRKFPAYLLAAAPTGAIATGRSKAATWRDGAGGSVAVLLNHDQELASLPRSHFVCNVQHSTVFVTPFRNTFE
jgi:hypothetical protein